MELEQDKGYFQHERRVLHALKAQGYEPNVIYDVGAATGFWSETVKSVAPDAEYHLFEPLANTVDFYQRDLEARMPRMPRATLYPIALSDTTGSAEMFVTRDGYSSSLHDRGTLPDISQTVVVPKFRLDDFVEQRGLPAPDVIKIDSQGLEAAILRGAVRALQHAKVLFLETWFVRGYGPNTPLLGEIIELLREHSFTLVEVGERFYDDRHRLYSIDAFFFADSFLERFCLPAEI